MSIVNLINKTQQKYKLKLKSGGEPIEYRPFNVAEQKVLLTAKQSEDKANIQQAVCDLVNACTFGLVDAKSLPIFDLERLFLALRAKSVGNIATFKYIDEYYDEDNEYNEEELTVSIDLDKIEIKGDLPNNVIIFDEETNFGIQLNYPTIDDIDTEDSIDTIINCIELVFDKESMYTKDMMSKQELIDFVGCFTQSQVQQVKEFFEAMPRLEHTETIKLTNDRTKDITFKGIESFFG